MQKKTPGYEAKHTSPPRAEVNNVIVHPHLRKCFHGAVLTQAKRELNILFFLDLDKQVVQKHTKRKAEHLFVIITIRVIYMNLLIYYWVKFPI